MIHTLRQLQFLPVAATAACLRSIGRIDLNYLFTSIFRFVLKVVKKHTPGGVSNTFIQTAETSHVIYLQIFYDNCIKRINKFSGFLMNKVMSFVRNPFVNSGNDFMGFSAFRRTFNLFGELTLRFRQSFFFLAEKPRVRDDLSIRKCGKVCHPHIEGSDGFNRLRDRNVLDITDKSYEPFSGRRSADGAGLDTPIDRPVFADLDTAYFRQLDVVISKGETTLRVAERVVSKLAAKAWVARLLTSFYPLEEGSKGEVNAGRNVLKRLAEGVFQEGVFLLKLFNSIALVVKRKTYFISLPSRFALFKKMIVEPAASVKRCLKCMCLCAIRIDSIFESFSHNYILTKGLYNVKLKLFA